MPGSFLDTNVLLYVASKDPVKAQRAEALLANGCVISVQVLNEIANVARRKMRLAWHETLDFLALVRGLAAVEPITTTTHDAGLRVAARYKLSIYDGMIVASALGAGCTVLYSEDMQDGLEIDSGLRIVNPFK